MAVDNRLVLPHTYRAQRTGSSARPTSPSTVSSILHHPWTICQSDSLSSAAATPPFTSSSLSPVTSIGPYLSCYHGHTQVRLSHRPSRPRHVLCAGRRRLHYSSHIVDTSSAAPVQDGMPSRAVPTARQRARRRAVGRVSDGRRETMDDAIRLMSHRDAKNGLFIFLRPPCLSLQVTKRRPCPASTLTLFRAFSLVRNCERRNGET